MANFYTFRMFLNKSIFGTFRINSYKKSSYSILIKTRDILPDLLNHSTKRANKFADQYNGFLDFPAPASREIIREEFIPVVSGGSFSLQVVMRFPYMGFFIISIATRPEWRQSRLSFEWDRPSAPPKRHSLTRTPP